MKVDYQLLGQRIANRRKNNKITQERLAEYLDVSIAFVSKIERGKTQISLERLVQICQFLDISPGELITGAQPNTDTYMNHELSELLEKCPKELIPVIKSVIEDMIQYYPRQT